LQDVSVISQTSACLYVPCTYLYSAMLNKTACSVDIFLTQHVLVTTEDCAVVINCMLSVKKLLKAMKEYYWYWNFFFLLWSIILLIWAILLTVFPAIWCDCEMSYLEWKVFWVAKFCKVVVLNLSYCTIVDSVFWRMFC
jgi:hypothetical protein